MKKIKIIIILIIIFFLILILINIKIKKEEIISELEEYTVARKNMVETQLKTRDINDKKVLEVMGKVLRHEFIEEYKDKAYEDHPLPIGYGQTISQPYIVALMTQSLEVKEDDVVLEIGTGSGYQAAVLAEIAKEVYTIEIIDKLAKRANNTLQRLGYRVNVMNADGYFGWPNKKFDKIIVTAAANHIPNPLLEQLKDNGKLIIPLGSTLTFQTLTLVTKKDNELETEYITGVRFVPMTGKAQE